MQRFKNEHKKMNQQRRLKKNKQTRKKIEENPRDCGKKKDLWKKGPGVSKHMECCQEQIR